MTDLPPVGSRWYAWGRHYEVIAHTRRDGEPAVRVREKDQRKPHPFAIVVRSFLRHATPAEASAWQ